MHEAEDANRSRNCGRRRPADRRSAARAVNARQKNDDAGDADTIGEQHHGRPRTSRWSAPLPAHIRGCRGSRHEPRPHQSKFLNRLRSGSSKSTSRQVETVTMMPGTTLTRNSQCQEKSVGQIAADGRPDGRRERRHEADDRRDDGLLAAERWCRRRRRPSGSCRRR